MVTEYVYRILAQGNCEALVRGGVFYNGSEPIVVWDLTGLVRLPETLSIMGQEDRSFSRPRMLIDAVRQTMCAVQTADDWLIPLGALDLSPENIWYDASSQIVRLCILSDDGPEQDQSNSRCAVDIAAGLFEDLSLYMPHGHADVFCRRLREAEKHGRLGIREIKKLLSRWEMDIC